MESVTIIALVFSTVALFVAWRNQKNRADRLDLAIRADSDHIIANLERIGNASVEVRSFIRDATEEPMATVQLGGERAYSSGGIVRAYREALAVYEARQNAGKDA